MTSTRRAKLARRNRARLNRRWAQIDAWEAAVETADEFPVMTPEGTVVITLDEVIAQIEADLAADGDETGPSDAEEARRFLVMNMEDGELRRLPDGRWHATGGHLADCLAARR